MSATDPEAAESRLFPTRPFVGTSIAVLRDDRVEQRRAGAAQPFLLFRRQAAHGRARVAHKDVERLVGPAQHADQAAVERQREVAALAQTNGRARPGSADES